MNTTEPKEFLNLVNINDSYNYSLYKSGGSKTGEDVITHYTKIRIDPETLIVDIYDKTFSSSTGQLYSNGSPFLSAGDYGTAWDCVAAYSHQGEANINLEGTPFFISNDVYFEKPQSGNVGYASAGTENFNENRQIVDTTGGGSCGANCIMIDGNYGLKLDFLEE